METGKVINRISNRLRRRSAALQETLGMSGAQGNILNFILVEGQKHSIYQKDIEKEFGLRPSTATEVLKALEKKELMSIFYKAVDMLPPQKREICLMKVREELSNQEIADRLKLSINTIKTHYSDALKLLRVHLGKLLIFVTYLTLLRYLSVYLTV